MQSEKSRHSRVRGGHRFEEGAARQRGARRQGRVVALPQGARVVDDGGPASGETRGGRRGVCPPQRLDDGMQKQHLQGPLSTITPHRSNRRPRMVGWASMRAASTLPSPPPMSPTVLSANGAQSKSCWCVGGSRRGGGGGNAEMVRV